MIDCTATCHNDDMRKDAEIGSGCQFNQKCVNEKLKNNIYWNKWSDELLMLDLINGMNSTEKENARVRRFGMQDEWMKQWKNNDERAHRTRDEGEKNELL